MRATPPARPARHADGTPVWQIVAREAKHDSKEHTIYYKDAQLKFGPVPVFYTPYFEYPDPTVTRRTGFLLPSVHWGQYGFGLTTPYFWAINRSMDLTFAPMWTTKRGPLADLEFRQALAAGTYSVAGWGLLRILQGRQQSLRHAVARRGAHPVRLPHQRQVDMGLGRHAGQRQAVHVGLRASTRATWWPTTCRPPASTTATTPRRRSSAGSRWSMARTRATCRSPRPSSPATTCCRRRCWAESFPTASTTTRWSARSRSTRSPTTTTAPTRNSTSTSAPTRRT